MQKPRVAIHKKNGSKNTSRVRAPPRYPVTLKKLHVHCNSDASIFPGILHMNLGLLHVHVQRSDMQFCYLGLKKCSDVHNP